MAPKRSESFKRYRTQFAIAAALEDQQALEDKERAELQDEIDHALQDQAEADQQAQMADEAAKVKEKGQKQAKQAAEGEAEGVFSTIADLRRLSKTLEATRPQMSEAWQLELDNARNSVSQDKNEGTAERKTPKNKAQAQPKAKSKAEAKAKSKDKDKDKDKPKTKAQAQPKAKSKAEAKAKSKDKDKDKDKVKTKAESKAELQAAKILKLTRLVHSLKHDLRQVSDDKKARKIRWLRTCLRRSIVQTQAAKAEALYLRLQHNEQ
jgi:hypothetical protein